MRFFTIALLIFCSFSSLAQSDSLLRPLSKYEQFISRTGVVLMKEEVLLGKLRGLELKYRKATVLSDKSVAESISLGNAESLLWPAGNIIYIDKDELDEVISALEYFKEIMSKGKPANEARYTFITANRVSVTWGYLFNGLGRAWTISFTQLYKDSPDMMPGSFVHFRDRDIDELITMLKTGIGMQL